MKKVKYIIGLAAAIMVSSVSANSMYAALENPELPGVKPALIESISVSHVILVDLDGPVQHSEQCHSQYLTPNILAIAPEAAYFKEMYSAILAAKVSGKHIIGWTNGCVDVFTGISAPKLVTVEIID